MKIIIDTHIFLWVLSEPERLSENKIREIVTQANQIYISSISIAELAIKASLGKIDISFDPIEMAEKSGFDLIDFTAKDAMQLKDLPYYHRDPFDRMIIAQSIVNKCYIMTDDNKFSLYDCRVL